MAKIKNDVHCNNTLIITLLLCSLYNYKYRPVRLPDLGLGGVSQIMFSLCNSYCMLFFVLVLSGALLGQKESSDSQLQTESHHCPTWTYFNSDTHSCQCGDPVYRIISCSTEDGNVSDVGVLFRFCMTQNKERTKIVVGPCPYNNNIKT